MLTFVEAAAVLAAALMGGIAARVTVPTRRTIPAVAPWTVTGAVAVVAVQTGAYDSLGIDVSPLTATAAVATVATTSWVACVELADLRELPYRDRYLAATGAAAGLVLGGTLLFYVDFPLLELVWLAIAPVAAGVLAALGYFVLGLIYTDALTELRLSGLYTLGVIVLDGIASAVVVEQLGGEETAVTTSLLVRLADVAGVDPFLWALVPGHLGVGIGFVAACGLAARKRHEAGLLPALVVSVAVLWSSTVVLLSAVLLG